MPKETKAKLQTDRDVQSKQKENRTDRRGSWREVAVMKSGFSLDK